MAEPIEFVSNYQDSSTNEGFQFEFYCNRCHSGLRTTFKPYAAGRIAGVLDTASSIFGGLLSNMSRVSHRVRDAAWEKAHDAAFTEAVQEIKPHFIQCPRCSSWVCRKVCWNTNRGLCKSCAPDLGVEMSAAQASRSVEEVWAHAAMAEEDKKLARENWRETIRASCPQCEAPLATNAKFCPACGTPLKAKDTCACGAKLTPGAKFCSDCGAKQE
ncbi:MAG TPA: zinc ribbon domain-containing protein [Firmicutes bacterium]|jgi:hypothetical protein|nr:zinc ribbon domain-containing protein [Bacillota bacterium]